MLKFTIHNVISVLGSFVFCLQWFFSNSSLIVYLWLLFSLGEITFIPNTTNSSIPILHSVFIGCYWLLAVSVAVAMVKSMSSRYSGLCVFFFSLHLDLWTKKWEQDQKIPESTRYLWIHKKKFSKKHWNKKQLTRLEV